MQIIAKQAVALAQQLPPRDELKFLEKQPANKKLIQQTNDLLLSLFNDFKSLSGEEHIQTKTVAFKAVEDTIDLFLENAQLLMDKAPDEQVTKIVEKLEVIEKKKTYTKQLNTFPFIPVLKSKPHALVELDPRIAVAQEDPEKFFQENDLEAFPHPYEQEIKSANPTHTISETIGRYRDLGEPVMITNVDELAEMVMRIQNEVDLKGQTEIALDLEHHHQYSYLGITCLIQLSTRTTDYIIDPFSIWDQIGDILSVIMANPKIIKVLHGAESDVLWLQRDFGLYIVSLFDTYHASKELLLPQNSFAYLLSEYCKKYTDKSFQTADWTLRPLTPDMIKYAQMDTHYLLYIYDRMKVDLNNFGLKQGKNLLHNAVEKSRETSLKIYKKPLQDQDQTLSIMLNRQDRRMDQKTYDLTVKLLEWRENIGLEYDENPRYFLPNAILFKLTEATITTIKDLYYYLGGDRRMSPIVKDNAWQILKILLENNSEIPQVTVPQASQNAIEEEVPIIQTISSITLELIPIQITIQPFAAFSNRLVSNEDPLLDVHGIRQSFECQSSFKLLDHFHKGLGEQIFKSMKENTLTNPAQDTNKPEYVAPVPTEEFMQFPKGEAPPKKETDVKLQSLESQHSIKLRRKYQRQDEIKVKKQLGNRFEM